MNRSPSSDAPRDGSSTGRTFERGVGRELRARPKLRVPELLRLLRLLAFAIATVVCAGLTGPGRGLATVAGPADVATSDVASAAWWVSASVEASRQWCDGAPPVQRDVAEAEIGDDTDDDDVDGDARSEISDGSVADRRVGAPRMPARALRGVPSTDTSHFAIADGFPRGPPT